MPTAEQPNRIAQILSLVGDPQFAEFEIEQDAPTIFRTVGRTSTETWHSALLGWLLDPSGSHHLGLYPIRRLLLLLQTRDAVGLEGRGIDLHELLACGELSSARVRPNERDLTEVSVADMRFDVLVDTMRLRHYEVQILIEAKVKAPIERDQCVRYLQYVNERRQSGVCIVPVFLAPTPALGDKDPELLLGDARWILVDYQEVYDDIIAPCLRHPELSEFGRFMLTEYTKTLKQRLGSGGGVPMAISQRERDLVNSLMERHGPAIHALYEILSARSDEFDPGVVAGSRPQVMLKIEIANTTIQGPSVRFLYEAVLRFLHARGDLEKLELPIAAGPKRYLIAREPVDQLGNPFIAPAGASGYFMEANKSRESAMRDLERLAQVCGVSYTVLSV